ncbi:hypothetical protein [Pantoea sp.]|uniref:hypothetical protein n=1 Tax=Pantoea sp. TaxID=69393 RepID=UPI00289F4B5D|nr:hypothetical protein [Pantoea sp.]
MSIEYILGTIGVALAALITVFGWGHSKGKATAEQAASERETQRAIEAQQAASQRQTETAKEASDVQGTVTRMSGSDVDNELRNEWINKG